jgi:hypothetical protein
MRGQNMSSDPVIDRISHSATVISKVIEEVGKPIKELGIVIGCMAIGVAFLLVAAGFVTSVGLGALTLDSIVVAVFSGVTVTGASVLVITGAWVHYLKLNSYHVAAVEQARQGVAEVVRMIEIQEDARKAITDDIVSRIRQSGIPIPDDIG